MPFLKVAFGLSLLLLSSCGGLKHLPPSAKDGPHPEEEAWSATFKLAQELSKNGHTEEACVHWNHLARQEEFPLRELPFIYQIYCLKSGEEVDAQLKNFTPKRYLKKPYFETLARSPIVEAERPQLKITALEGLASLSLSKSDKMRFLKDALTVSKKCHDEVAEQRIQKKLDGYSSKPSVEISEERYLDVAKEFIKEREYTTARRYLERIIFKKQDSLEYLVEAWKIYAKTFKSEQDRDKYKLKMDALFRYLVKETKKMHPEKIRKKDRIYTDEEKKQGMDFLSEVGIELARAQWTDDEDKKALGLLEKIKNFQIKYLEKYEVEIDVLMGKIYLSDDDLGKAKEYFDLALSSRELGDQTRADILHQTGFHLLLKDKWAEAAPYFERALKLGISNFDKSKFQFWLAKIKKFQSNETATEDFKKLIVADNMGFYGTLAHFELGLPLTPLASLNLEDQVLDATFEWLLYFKLYDLANIYILENTSAKKTAKEELESEKTLLLLSRASQHHEVFYRLNKMENTAYEKFTTKYPTILIPTPFLEIFKRGAERSQLEVELLMAIAKQESGFYEFAKSPADAYGIMQLIMPSAELAAKDIKMKLEGPDDLYVPDINLTLGPVLFKKYLERFDGRIPETIMSYNAGPEAASRWARKYFLPYCSDPSSCSGEHRFDSTLLLMELVSYKETNGYVKRVLRNYFNYKRLLSTRPLMPEELKTVFY